MIIWRPLITSLGEAVDFFELLSDNEGLELFLCAPNAENVTAWHELKRRKRVVRAHRLVKTENAPLVGSASAYAAHHATARKSASRY